MVFRIHFTIQDLARTRVAEAPRPLFELDLAVRALQDRSQPVRLDAWRRRSRERLPVQARMAMSLIPSAGWSPSMFQARAGNAGELLDRVRSMAPGRIRANLALLAERRPIPSWARRLADDAAAYQQFVDGLAGLYATLVAPHEALLTDLFAADRSMRMRQLLDRGVEGLLTQVNPRWMRWNPPVLEIQMRNGVDYDLRLEGQGILLVPSTFGTRSFVDCDARPQPAVTYPAGQDRPLHGLTAFAPGTSAISAILGRTRAAVLTAVAEHPGCSTKQLAGIVGVASASASEHATVLREARLITTVRDRNMAIHSPTDLGIALLNRSC
jgi:DNA-binding transcriptional ArsR family regulator